MNPMSPMPMNKPLLTRLRVSVFSLALAVLSPLLANEPQSLQTIPSPISNNAVAGISLNGEQYLMSFMGLTGGKTHDDIVLDAWLWSSTEGTWQQFEDVPVVQGRLASVAVGMHDRILLFGGYTVAPDGAEVSSPEVFIIDPVERTYKRRADIPRPVDDTVAIPYANRYIYLVSGWHDTGNVSEVQLYDTWEDTWTRATDFPGVPVFGHAGGGSGNTLVIVGGVGVLGKKDGKRQFGAIDQAWKGKINPADPTVIDWQPLPVTTGTNRYRMAATALRNRPLVVFAGGTDRPYNFSGIGYDGIPAEPTGSVFAYDIENDAWVHYPDMNRAPSMDHRGLLEMDDGRLITIGGMGNNQRVLGQITAFKLLRKEPR